MTVSLCCITSSVNLIANPFLEVFTFDEMHEKAFDIFSTKAETRSDVGMGEVELIKTPEWPGPGEESAVC